MINGRPIMVYPESSVLQHVTTLQQKARNQDSWASLFYFLHTDLYCELLRYLVINPFIFYQSFVALWMSPHFNYHG